MNFTFFKRQRILLQYTKEQTGNSQRCCVRSCQSCTIFHCFSGRSGAASVYFELLDFSEKARRDGTFYFHFFKIVHQRDVFGRIKQIMKFCNCQIILDIYSQGLLNTQTQENEILFFITISLGAPRLQRCEGLRKPDAKMLRHSHEKRTFLALNRCWSQVCQIYY